ncbi:MAG: energy transducer TonB, partial [Pyrinomonadaceae bacterium]
MKKQTKQTKQRCLAFLLSAFAVIVILGSSVSTFAQDKLEKDYRGFPVKLSSLVEALKSGEFQENEIITIVNENGVSFPLTSDNEKKLRTAGANSELIAAVRQKFFSSSGVVNGKAANLIAPTYPAAARDAHAGGSVNVAVTIDADGNVLTAHAVSG